MNSVLMVTMWPQRNQPANRLKQESRAMWQAVSHCPMGRKGLSGQEHSQWWERKWSQPLLSGAWLSNFDSGIKGRKLMLRSGHRDPEIQLNSALFYLFLFHYSKIFTFSCSVVLWFLIHTSFLSPRQDLLFIVTSLSMYITYMSWVICLLWFFFLITPPTNLLLLWHKTLWVK